MPDEEKEVETAAPPPPPAQSKKKTYIIIAVLVVLISLFVVTKVMGDIPGGGSGEEDDSGPRYHDAGIFVKLGDPKEGILVNVGGPRSGKYLKASIIVEFNPGKKAVINDSSPTPKSKPTMLRRNSCAALRLKTSTPTNRTNLKSNSKTRSTLHSAEVPSMMFTLPVSSCNDWGSETCPLMFLLKTR